MRLLGICGSLRRDSWNRRALEAARELVPPGVELEVFDELKAVPPYDEDDDVVPAPAAVERLRDAIARADAVLIATPEYNGSVPGQLKNAIDWASRPFPDSSLRNKPAAVFGGSPSPFGAVWAQAELRKILGVCGARVVDREVALAELPGCFTDGGRLDSEWTTPLRDLIDALLAAATERERHLTALAQDTAEPAMKEAA